MKRGPISTGTATVCAIGIAAVLTIAVSAVLLLVPGEGAPDTGAAQTLSALPVEVVAGYRDGGSADAPVIRISGTQNAINLTACRVYLIDPKGALYEVETAILRNATLSEGMTAYVFHSPWTTCRRHRATGSPTSRRWSFRPLTTQGSTRSPPAGSGGSSSTIQAR